MRDEKEALLQIYKQGNCRGVDCSDCPGSSCLFDSASDSDGLNEADRALLVEKLRELGVEIPSSTTKSTDSIAKLSSVLSDGSCEHVDCSTCRRLMGAEESTGCALQPGKFDPSPPTLSRGGFKSEHLELIRKRILELTKAERATPTTYTSIRASFDCRISAPIAEDLDLDSMVNNLLS